MIKSSLLCFTWALKCHIIWCKHFNLIEKSWVYLALRVGFLLYCHLFVRNDIKTMGGHAINKNRWRIWVIPLPGIQLVYQCVCVCQIRLIIYLPRMCLLNVTVVLLCKQWIIYLSYPLTPCSPVWQTVCFWKGPPPTDWTNTSQFLITCIIDLYYPASHLQSKINRNRK